MVVVVIAANLWTLKLLQVELLPCLFQVFSKRNGLVVVMSATQWLISTTLICLVPMQMTMLYLWQPFNSLTCSILRITFVDLGLYETQ